MKIDDSKYEAFVGAARKVAQYELVQCSSGNLSWRVGPDQAMLSGSGAWLAELTAEQIVLCELSSGARLNDVRPTCEAGFHIGILKARKDIDVVLHFQSPYATALACGDAAKHDLNLTIEVPVYIGEASLVDYLPPGSNELAGAVVNAFADSDTRMAILKNHGLVTVGKTFDEAIQKAVFFEQACHIRLTNPDARPLDSVAVNQLRDLGKA
ncbi:MAG: class II aldolase/adducin family protein [Planctomycetes bacterium]|nr:class II aldolase/adducin family protein [Planctomycetota bacterium]